MKIKKLLTTIVITLLFGSSACSNNKTETKEPTPTPVITEAVPTQVTPTEATPTETAPTSGETQPSTSEKQLSTYYETIGTLDDNYEFATSYIDSISSKDQIADYAKDHNLTDYEIADCSGMECYLITPKYENTTIKVEQFSDFEQTKTENILDTQKPVFVLCNPSDIWSNSQITISYDDKAFVFSPFISCKDGTPILPEYANPGK